MATWVKLDTAPPDGGFATALSARGNEVSSFFLGYRAVDGGRWEMYTTEKDATVRGSDYAVRSGDVATVGKWTHLAAVFDKPSQTMRLYVDGVLNGSAARPTGFSANGPMIVGHGKWNGVDGANPWLGSIDELRVFSRPLNDAEVQGVLTRESAAVGSWKLDGDLRDDSKSAKHGTAVNGPTWVPGQSIHGDAADKALRLDGVDDYASAGTAVNTSRSFTVSAWVKPEQVSGPVAAVSQSGTTNSAFTLGFDDKKRWSFTMLSSGGSVQDEAKVYSDTVAQPGVWAHVAGAYDKSTARSGCMSTACYVDGRRPQGGSLAVGGCPRGESPLSPVKLPPDRASRR